MDVTEGNPAEGDAEDGHDEVFAIELAVRAVQFTDQLVLVLDEHLGYLVVIRQHHQNSDDLVRTHLLSTLLSMLLLWLAFIL